VAARSDFVAGFTYWVLKDYKQRAGYNQACNGISVMGLLTFAEERPELVYDAFRKAVSPGPADLQEPALPVRVTRTMAR
jgi:beta-glucuronidase